MTSEEARLRLILEEFVQRVMALLEREVTDPAPIPPPEEVVTSTVLTKRAMIELISHEAIVHEAYKDSKGIWTWGIGVTDASGHKIGRYKDSPQTTERVIEIFKWLVETKYLPDVLKAFEGHPLNEHQLAAALSFHYNTGAIGRASWVRSFKAGNIDKARTEIMNWRTPKEIISRREKERDLFFDGRWSNDGKVTTYLVNKPSYTPNWGSAKRIDITGKI